ncbi:hypothetical protein ACLB2K_043924 [Fragaria x ananassa]
MSTPSPMEIYDQNPQHADDIPDQNGVVQLVASTPLVIPQDKVLVSVEVCLKASSTARIDDVRSAVERMLEKRSLSYTDGPVPVPPDDLFLTENVERICICDTDEWVQNHDILLFWQARPVVHVFPLSEEGACEDVSGDGQPSTFNEWILPAKEFDGMWESLIYESGLKARLLRYAASALHFTEKGVNPFLVSWNRIVLLHGPPGTGKTSLCKALAQKLSIRFNSRFVDVSLFSSSTDVCLFEDCQTHRFMLSRYPQSQLVEVNAHSLFSKWFSESGKLVAKLFQKLQEMVEEETNLVFVLIDEVESLAAARKSALSGSEPSDSIRVVNALLTQLDKLKSAPNVIILTTSNITAAIDIAFVDRADIKAYVGPPTLQARYEILRSCLEELIRTGILSSFEGCESLMLLNYASLKEKLNMPQIHDAQTSLHLCRQLLETAEACDGLSGRSLRKLPFLAHAALSNPYSCDPSKFLCAMTDTARRERSEIPD